MNPTVTSRPMIVASTLITLLGALVGVVAASEGRAGKGRQPWEAPARAARKANPFPADAASVKAGKVVYIGECLDCHGRRGAGDGAGARDLKTKVPGLSNPEVWRQSDGALFWKVSTGRGDMPGFDDKLTEEQRWRVVSYLRATWGTPAGDGDDAVVAGQRKRAEEKR